MSDDQMTRLRRGFEAIIRLVKGNGEPGLAVNTADPYYPAISLYDPIKLGNPLPDLTPFEQMCLSGLLGDEKQLPQAIADYLLDQGYEYAVAVAEKATMAERVRCVKLMSPVLNDLMYDKKAFDAREAMRYPTGRFDQAFNDAWYADTHTITPPSAI